MAVALVNRLVTALATPERLPRLDFGDGIPASERTMVIVPTLFTSVEGVRAQLEQLEVAALGNLDPHLHFALLSDVADADAQHLPEDAALVQAAVDGIEALNRQPWAEGGDRFFLFHRERRWNPGEHAWMGWERKRGKIEEFNRRLRGADRHQLRGRGRRRRSAAVDPLLPDPRQRHPPAARCRPVAGRRDRPPAQPPARRSPGSAASSRATASCSRGSA